MNEAPGAPIEVVRHPRARRARLVLSVDLAGLYRQSALLLVATGLAALLALAAPVLRE